MKLLFVQALSSRPQNSDGARMGLPDLNLKQPRLVVLLDIDVDGEMCVDVSHLVSESLGDADDQILNDGSDRAERGDILADTVVELDDDDVLLGVRKADG